MLTRSGHIILAGFLALLSACAAPRPASHSAGASSSSGPSASEQAKSADLSDLLAQIKAAYQSGDYNRGLALVKTVLEAKTADVSTFDRLGSVYFALGRYGDALSMWGQALPLEQDLRKRRRLQGAIASTRRSLGLPDEPLTQAGLASASPRDKLAPAIETLDKPSAPTKEDRKRAKELYKEGVKHYAQGEYLEATTLFQQALELEPGNGDAKKALERLRLGS